MRRDICGVRSLPANLMSKMNPLCPYSVWTANTKSTSHKHLQLPLIPVEEFLEQYPKHINDDEKSLMFARIEHELSVREALEQARQGLLKKKQSLIADNKKRKDDLASLDKDLETFIDVRPNCYSLLEFMQNTD